MERFWKKVERSSGCWLWLAYIDRDGYGRFQLGSTSALAHRVAYELSVGPIPAGLQIDHICRVRACVNPAHLRPLTKAENDRIGMGPPAINARKTACIHGHPFTDANTYRPGGSRRSCRLCNALAVRAYKARLLVPA